MLTRISLSIFVVVEIVTWRHAEGKYSCHRERADCQFITTDDRVYDQDVCLKCVELCSQCNKPCSLCEGECSLCDEPCSHCDEQCILCESQCPECEREEKYRRVCPDLEKPEDGEIIDGKCKKAKPGGNCNFGCNEGYRLDGSGTLICMSHNLKWSHDPPKCIKDEKQCPDLEKPDNGEIVNGKCKKAKPGENCLFKCNQDYRLDGEALLFCRSDNLQWSHASPKCIKDEKQCPDLEKPDNGEIPDGKCKKATAGDYCNFKCNEGHHLDGNAMLVCMRISLTWSTEPPKCIKDEKYCPDLEKPDNGEFLGGKCKKAKPGENCLFKCNQDYRLEGDALLFCSSDNLKWSNGPPKCIQEVKYCLDLEEPDHGEIVNGECKKKTPGEICEFKCAEDYSLNGNAILSCQSENINWSTEPPKCIKEEKYCPDLQEPEYGEIFNGNCKKATLGKSCEFKCHKGYHLVGHAVLSCRKDQEWSHKRPECIKNEKKPVEHPHDCAAIKKNKPEAKTDVYTIWPKGVSKPIQVRCDMTTEGGGWTVFQRRGDFNEKENFYRSWHEYENGFGNREREYWLGLDAIHAITSLHPQTLRIDMEDFDGSRKYARYANFGISGSGSDYKLQIKGYSGDAGDSLGAHNNYRFSTKDSGNTYCAKLYKGAWWYVWCHNSNLNGRNLRGKQTTFADGINWLHFRGWWYSLKSSEMKIRSRSY